MEVISIRHGTLPASLDTLKLGKPLGKGGFAVVFRGYLKAASGNTFPVAVKVLHPEYSDESSQELRLFKEEAELMLQLDHRNIISAYGLLKLQPNFPGLEGHTQCAHALVLELMEGGSLAKLMVKQVLAGGVPKYTFSQALDWVRDVARALQYLHLGGKDGFPRIHRDVKLENVLLTAGMQTAKLADFGLQRAIFAQHPERRNAMLLRRSVRPSIHLPTRPAAGLSRLAPESERSSHRQAPAANPGRDRRSSASGFIAACTKESGKEEDLASEPVFFAVDDNGLTPVVLPNSPQPLVAPDLQPADVAAGGREKGSGWGPSQKKAQGQSPAQSPTQQLARVRAADIARRSRSMSQLDQVSKNRDTWSSQFGSGASSARSGGGLVQRQDSDQLPRGGSGWSRNPSNLSSGKGNRSPRVALQVAMPTSPGRPGSPGSGRCVAAGAPPAPRSLLPAAAGNSPSAARPSPLGHPQSARWSSSMGDSVSRFEARSLAEESQASALAGANGSLAPRTPAGSAPRMAVESVRAAETCAEVADLSAPQSLSVPPEPGAADLRAAPPLFSSVSVPYQSGLTTTCRVSPSGPTRPAMAAVQRTTDGPRPSTASVRDVLLEGERLQVQTQDSRGLSPMTSALAPPSDGPTSAAAQLRGPQSGGMRAMTATAPGGSTEMAESVSQGRLQVLTATGMVEATAKPTGPGAAGAGFSPTGSTYELLRPAGSANVGSAVPPIAVECSAKLDCLTDGPSVPGAPRARTGSGMVGTERDRSSLSRHAGDGGRGTSLRISVVAPSSCRAAGDGTPMTSPSDGISPHRSSVQPAGQQTPSQHHQHVHMADLLHLRLGAQSISVRSVRSSANGAMNRQMLGSAPSSPRLASMTAAAVARTAAAAGGWQAEAGPRCAAGAATGTGELQSTVSAGLAAQSSSLPTVMPASQLPMGTVKSGPQPDFEEVFSLTGRTGSLMYLAPEAYKNEPYNDKVDVYSLAILMYELFGRTSITYTHISTKLPAFSRMLCNADEFAERVAAGYRPPRTNAMAKMPPQLWELIESGWHQDPVQRPDIGTVLEELDALVDPLAEAELGSRQGQLARAGCGCIIS